MKDECTTRAAGVGMAWRALFCLPFIVHPSYFILSQDVPVVGQPSADFYGAAGSGVKVAWTVEPTEIPEDGEIVATLGIANVTNPRKIARPDLKKLPAFNDRFVVTDNADRSAAERATEVEFSYRLRPRSRQTAEVPTLNFYYFNPAAPVGKQFKLTNTGRPVPIKVTTAPPKVAPPSVPLTEPDHLFAIATGPAILARGSSEFWDWACLAVGLAGPLFALGWYVAWRRVYPDAQRLAKLRRSHAARRAVDAIQRADRAPDPPAAVAAAMLQYLRARFPLSPAAVTPSEIGTSLAELGMPAEDGEAVARFFRTCDAARFSPGSDNGLSLAADAEALVARLEAV